MSRGRSFRGDRRSRRACGAAGAQRGLTLVELMIALALGLLVALAATALLVSTKAGYAAQDESARLQETGRYALEVIARAVRQAAYQEFDGDDRPALADPASTPGIQGIDAASLPAGAPGIESAAPSDVNGSDVLALQYFGSGTGDDGDATILNCAGFGVPAPPPAAKAPARYRRWSIFYVAKGADGEPELRCKFRGQRFDDNSWAAQPIARGVESFQVLYGIDTDGDGSPNRYLDATALDRLDAAIVPEGADAAARHADKNRKTYWKKVVAVKVALLVRGAGTVPTDSSAERYDLFGPAYGDAQAGADAGTRIELASLPAKLRTRIRKTFGLTLLLRNASGGGKP